MISVSVCLSVFVSVCLSASLSPELRARSSLIFRDVIYGRGSVLLWGRRDTLSTSGFMDDVIFAHNVSAYIATRKGRALKITLQVAAPGAESAVYDYFVSTDVLPCQSYSPNSPRPPVFQNTDGISKHRLSPYTSTVYITNITFYLMFPVPSVI